MTGDLQLDEYGMFERDVYDEDGELVERPSFFAFSVMDALRIYYYFYDNVYHPRPMVNIMDLDYKTYVGLDKLISFVLEDLNERRYSQRHHAQNKANPL